MKNVLKKASLVAVALSCALFFSCANNQSQEKLKPLQIDSSYIQGELDNGMTYFVRKNSEPQNRIVLRLVVRAGSNMEDEDQRGVAHFVEHLAFNGTEHFGKSEIVDYFEKIGMDFGSDLNAYTNFDETVYKLEIPADDPEILQKALLILHDWACSISFDQEEIDKERGVVTEEWRLRQGLRGRVSDKIVPFLLKDSRYQDRMPIGTMDVIHNVSRERILDFYNKWYRPEFMSIVAVGDIDSEVLKDSVLKVMNEIPASKDSLSHPKFDVPVQTEKAICMMRDPEQKYEVIQIFQQQEDFAPNKTEQDIREDLALSIGRTVFNNRLSEISGNPNSPWLEAFADQLAYTHTGVFEYLGVVPKEGQFEAAFKAFLDEYDRILVFGVTKSEVERIKKATLVSAEQTYKNREKITSAAHADSIVSYVVSENIPISSEDSFRIVKDCIEKITIDEINAVFKKYYNNRGTLMFFQAPDSVADIPEESVIMDIWTNYQNSEVLTAYEDDVSDDELMKRPDQKGKIVSQKEISELGVKEYIFENGIRVLTKKTDFLENSIQLSAISKGGLSLVSEKNVPSAKYSLNYMFYSGMNGLTYPQFIKKISTKNVNIDIDVSANIEYISGSATNEDFEVLMQMVNLIFANPQFQQEGWDLMMNELTEAAKKHGTQPMEVLVDRIKEILYGKDDIYTASLTESYVAKMNATTAKNEFNNRFGNAADFTFIFVGDFDEANLLENLEIYLGGLKTSKDREDFSFRTYKFPSGITKDVVKKGLDKQGQVYLGFGGDLPEEKDIEKYYYDRFMASELCSLLDIRLREVIREDKGGSYGIGVFGGIEGDKKRSYNFEINFGCEPDREDELAEEVINQIEIVQKELVSTEYTDKLQETLRRNREVSLRNNNWWVTRITNELVYENEPLWVSTDIEKICSWVTPEALQKQARKYLNTKNYISVFLKPEN